MIIGYMLNEDADFHEIWIMLKLLNLVPNFLLHENWFLFSF